MTLDQVNYIVEKRAVPYRSEEIDLVATHISWVLVGATHVYKIKKPKKFSFLDFSTLEKRKHFCQKELELNRRLAPSMYLDVLPITDFNGKIEIGGKDGVIIDYAVLMKRMDDTRQMDRLLECNRVTVDDIEALATILANFHQHAEVIEEGEDWKALFAEFEDVYSVEGYIVDEFGAEKGRVIKNMVNWAHSFLDHIQDRIAERNTKGFVIDGHGDLHSRNIFLLEAPVIFDCIEFNEEFRKLDVLSEIAFLCMDLERFGRFDLSAELLDRYLEKYKCVADERDRALFHFYKMYRANVRLKVHSLNAQSTQLAPSDILAEKEMAGQYLELLERYWQEVDNRGI